MKRSILIVVVFVFLPTGVFARGWFKNLGNDIANGTRDNITEGVTGRPVNRGQQQQEKQQAQEPQQAYQSYEDNGSKSAIKGSAKYQSGTTLRACGCYGNIQIGVARQNNTCASGVSQVVQCQGRCSGGGYPWGIICQ